MDFNYKGSLNKDEEQDSDSKPIASNSNANHLTTSLESEEQQAIIKSTNEIPRKQTIQLNHAHSIENILRKPRNPHNLGTEHLQEHTQELPHHSVANRHHVNFEIPGPSRLPNSYNTEALEQHQTTEPRKQHLLRKKDHSPRPHQPHTPLDLSTRSKVSQTVTLGSKQLPLKKRQKIVFHQRSIPVKDLPQLSPPQPQTGVKKELIIKREIQTVHQQTFYTHLKLTKPQTKSQNLQIAQTQITKQQLSTQDISYFRIILPHDRKEKHALQENASTTITTRGPENPQVQLPSHEHQRERLPSCQIDRSNFKTLNIKKLPSQSPNFSLNISRHTSQSSKLSLNIDNQPSESPNLRLNITSQLSQSLTSPLNTSKQNTQSQTLSFLSSNQQSQKETKVNSESTSRETLHRSNPQTLKAVNVQKFQSPNLLLNKSSQLSQSETSSLITSSQLAQSQRSSLNTFCQKSEKENQRNHHKQTGCESVLPNDLEPLEASKFKIPLSLLIVASHLVQFQTSSLKASSQQSHQRESQLNPEQPSPSGLKSLEAADLQILQSPNLLPTTPSQLPQSQTSSLNISSHLTRSQSYPFLRSSQRSQKKTQLNLNQASCESVLPSDLHSLENSDLKISHSPNLSLDISSQLPQPQTSSLDTSSQLPQSETSSLNTSGQQTQKETQLSPEQSNCESVLPSDLQISQSPNVLLNTSNQLPPSQTSSLNISNPLPQSETSLLDMSYQLTQFQTSPFRSSSQQSQKVTELNIEQESCESMIPPDLQSLEASDLTPEIDQTIEELMDSYLTSCNEI